MLSGVCITLSVFWLKAKKQIEVVSHSVALASTRIPYDSLKSRVVRLGDTSSYYNLQVAYMDNNWIEGLLPYALIMANKYGYTPAYYDVYQSIQGIDLYHSGGASTDYSLDMVDTASRKIALEYLLKAARQGDAQAQEVVETYRAAGRYGIR